MSPNGSIDLNKTRDLINNEKYNYEGKTKEEIIRNLTGIHEKIATNYHL